MSAPIDNTSLAGEKKKLQQALENARAPMAASKNVHITSFEDYWWEARHDAALPELAAKRAWEFATKQARAQATAAPVLAYPSTLTVELEEALGFMNFKTGPIAHIFQAAGFPVKRKCEAEQAFVLDRMVRAVLTHGINWYDAFCDDVRAQMDAAEAKEKSRQEQS